MRLWLLRLGADLRPVLRLGPDLRRTLRLPPDFRLGADLRLKRDKKEAIVLRMGRWYGILLAQKKKIDKWQIKRN